MEILDRDFDNSRVTEAVLMDLSSGMSLKILNLSHNYLSNRKQRVKINNSLSEWVDIQIGIQQGSV